MPHKPAMNANPPIAKSSGKISGLNSKASASPEFCIPVSIDIVFLSSNSSLLSLAKLYPNRNANKLCINTIKNTYCIYVRNNSKLL